MKTLYWITAEIVLTGTIAVLPGCKREEPASESPEVQAAGDVQKTAEETVAAAAEQTVCPVMGNPIDKDIFVEYEGKKVYFCCSACIETFQKDPKKYLSKLPQFDEK